MYEIFRMRVMLLSPAFTSLEETHGHRITNRFYAE